ncbi:MAG: response regulator [Nitrospirota bacterium]|nr:response regulator [Nitrospirota bacterium]
MGVSVTIAICASYAALELAGRVTAAHGRPQIYWLTGGAAVMGLGIWSMHYIGMLAFRLPIVVFYDWPTVLVSLLAAMLASGIALFVVSRPNVTFWHTVLGSICMGAGIAGMHYIGMMAMRLAAICLYNLATVAMSVGLAIAISFVAIQLAIRVRDDSEKTFKRKLISAIVMGAAIPMMHYTGMAAAAFLPSEQISDLSYSVNISLIGTVGIALSTMFVLIVSVLTSTVDRRYSVKTLEMKLDIAEAASRAKSAFLATMSHEIRTPMNGVIGMTGLLLDTNLTAEQREFAEIVRSSGEHLLAIINDILDFSKIEAGKMTLEIIDFDLRTTVAETVDLVAERAFGKGVNLACLVHADVPTVLRGDPGRLRQILLNLVSNAIKFTEQGEVVVSVKLDHHTENDATVRFEVQDTGIGLSPDAQGNLFQSFSQADSSTTRKYGGTGLGLAICKQLTKLMAGQIGVDSRLGGGSTFWFTVQLGTQLQGAQSGLDLASQDLRGRYLCIVDDHATNRRILELYAERWGVRCLLAEDGHQALERLRTAAADDDACDLAIIDMQMPGMDGLELARAINADPALASTRLVLLTSQGQRGDAKAAQMAGYAAYLTKPVREAQLYESLITVLKPPAQANAASPRPTLITRHSLAESNARSTARILLAEDNLVNQKVAVYMLEKLGYRVDLVANGLEALEALQRISYAVVLMDCQMPEMDGFAATTEIRRREALAYQNNKLEGSLISALTPLASRHVPIIAMTANAQQEDRDRCLASGMDDYVSKPVQLKVLEEIIGRWVSAPASLQPASGGIR